MNEKCFCHFNGFAVKDATARKAISEEAAAREQAIQQEAAAREQAIQQEAASREHAIQQEAAARFQAIRDEAAAREDAIRELEASKIKSEKTVDYIVEYWEDQDFRHYIRKYENGTAEAIFQSIWTNLSFTTEHNGFYAHDAGRVRVGLEEILQGVVPEYCSIYVTKVTKTTDTGEETFGPPVMGMVCGTPEYLEEYGVVSPRILFLADEMAQNVTLELELQCRWKWKKEEQEEQEEETA
jgi:hypothetical protein